MNSNYTGRVHRNLQSAFGPYTSHEIYEPKRKTPLIDRLCWGCVVVLLGWFAAVYILHGSPL